MDNLLTLLTEAASYQGHSRLLDLFMFTDITASDGADAKFQLLTISF